MQFEKLFVKYDQNGLLYPHKMAFTKQFTDFFENHLCPNFEVIWVYTQATIKSENSFDTILCSCLIRRCKHPLKIFNDTSEKILASFFSIF